MKNSGGQALVEAVIAFAIVMVVLVALLQLSGRSISNSGESSRQAVATNYATEGLQWVKSQRTSDGYESLVGHCSGGVCDDTAFCLNSLDWDNDCTVAFISGTEYNRILVLDSPVAGQLDALVTVSWVENGRTVAARQSFMFIER